MIGCNEDQAFLQQASNARFAERVLDPGMVAAS